MLFVSDQQRTEYLEVFRAKYLEKEELFWKNTGKFVGHFISCRIYFNF